MLWEVSVPIEAFRVYEVEADSEEEAKELVLEGDVCESELVEEDCDMDTDCWEAKVVVDKNQKELFS